MTKIARTAKALAAVTGALLAGVLAGPTATAAPHTAPFAASHPPVNGAGGCRTERDVSSAVVDYSGSDLFETEFRAATNRAGHAFLNDSRNPGGWVDLSVVPGAPRCVTETSLAVTEEDPGHLFITLLDDNGYVHRAACVTQEGNPITAANIATLCAPGFDPVPGTPLH
ncbi:hypothetical protein [Streptomyces sp. 142MFCol3.1]|uniref:hypothetical protein n=1 Tax=Streptomyces sp. 142MFCol3.1 TaxID=1172179 RepID=UPI000405C1AF|nr:hypothetical protein [Streptomyces sp. 142MFCol3.1]